MAATWSIGGYVVEREISRNSACVFYRGTGKQAGSVIIKVPRRDPPSKEDIAALQDEYALLAGLSVPGSVRPREFLRNRSACCVALEDYGGIPLASMRLRPMDSFFRIAIQLCGILSELHRGSMTHRSLNPQNIFVHPETEAVCVVDCSRVIRSLEEIREANPLQYYREMLAYVSPEQTGRINRPTDYRTDFYSLGTILYELLTGSPPFCSDDPLEIIHGHIAKEPSSPSTIDPSVPSPLSDIVLKLLAKRAEDRYQSASGIREDLEQCSRDWKQRKSIAPFPLGRNDVSDRFIIPQKLYGRQEELAAIAAAFDRACSGAPAMMLVTGPPGVGKTVLIEELYRPIAQRKGWFISGKFDQVVRNVPFGALIQAVQSLVRQLLTETEEELSLWKTRLLEALGNNSGVLAEVIPEISLILGRQQPPPALEPAETQNRFRHVFQNFLEVLAQREHPLVIFLDDLQWADPATLGLLQPLLTSTSIHHFFLICAYRDSEQDTIFLSQVLKGLEQSGAVLYRHSLQPLRIDELACLIQDTLRNERYQAETLAEIVFARTAGNPFFVRQFLKTLQQKRLISFDYDESKWVFNTEDIRKADISDNVLGLVTQKIQQLAPATQRALTLAACIGCSFDLKTLSAVCRNNPDDAAKEITEAIEQGLIFPTHHTADAYSFLHDRVQQAAYALIPEEERKLVHLTVGRLLRDAGNRSLPGEVLFDTVQHLNLGSDLVTEEAECLELAHLNLAAGRKAKSSTAYQAALAYFDAGLKLLDARRWDSEHELMIALHLEKAECEYLCGNFEKAERCFESILEYASTPIEKAQVYRLKMVQSENLSRYGDAVASGIQALSLFDVLFPQSTQAKLNALEIEIQKVQKALNGRSVEDLVDLHVMSDPEIRTIMKILTDLWAPAYLTGDQVLTQLISATMVRLSLTYGNIEESAYGYVTHAITIGPGRGDYISAHKFGRLALMLNDRMNDRRQRPKVHQQFNAHVNLWRQPLETSIPHAQEACRSGLEVGDFTYASYGAYTESWIGFLTTRDFSRFGRDFLPNLDLMRKLRMDGFMDAQKLILSWARALQGTTVSRFSLSTENSSEEAYFISYADNPFFAAIFHIAKLHLCVTFGDYRGALEIEQKARSVTHAVGGTVWPVLLNYWSSLARTALFREATEADRNSYMQEVLKQRDALGILAANCPANFRCQHLLLSAEIEGISDNHFDAAEFYEQALRFSRETGNLQSEALAHELYGRFWIERGDDRIAGVFLREAWRLYSELNAGAKKQELQEKYSMLRSWIARDAAEEPNPAALDISTAFKSVHAIAGAIELDNLLSRLINLSLENAGAQRGFFLREEEDELLIEAEGSVQNEIAVRQSKRIAPGLLSQAIVRYVRKTQESVILDDARTDDRFAGDYYIAQAQPKSVLCLPIVHQGKLGGILYLENNLTTHAFTADRIEIMRILSAQAAISLENAHLYEELREEAALRKHAEERNRTLLKINNAIITTLTHDDLFHAICRALRPAIDFDRSGLVLHEAKNNVLRLLAVGGGLVKPSSNTLRSRLKRLSIQRPDSKRKDADLRGYS